MRAVPDTNRKAHHMTTNGPTNTSTGNSVPASPHAFALEGEGVTVTPTCTRCPTALQRTGGSVSWTCSNDGCPVRLIPMWEDARFIDEHGTQWIPTDDGDWVDVVNDDPAPEPTAPAPCPGICNDPHAARDGRRCACGRLLRETPLELDPETGDQIRGTYPPLPETLTVLRRFRPRDGGEIIALFPEIDEPGGQVLSYMHHGQHGAADPGLVSRTTPVDPDSADARELVAELTRRGYRVRVVRRFPPRR